MNGTMKCINDKCAASFNTPMELFDGSFICPRCGKRLNEKITVTRVNSELYGLCSAYFGSYLELSSEALSSAEGQKSRVDMQKIREHKELAIRYCREAACLGHPEAMLTLGYYYEIGLVEKGSVLENCKAAYYYYNAVAQTAVVSADDGAVITEERVLQLRRAAARRLLNLLEEYSGELSSRDAQGRYSITQNSDRLRKLGLIGANEERDGGMSVTRTPHADYVRKTLEACIGKEVSRRPFFGFFTLTRGELIDFYGDEKDKSSLQSFLRNRRNRGVRLMYADSKKQFTTLTGAYRDDGRRGFKSGDRADPVYLYFYNLAYKPQEAPRAIRRYLKGARLGKRLEATEGEAIGELIGGAEGCDMRTTDRVFYADDVFFAYANDEQIIKTLDSIIGSLRKYVSRAD